MLYFMYAKKRNPARLRMTRVLFIAKNKYTIKTHTCQLFCENYFKRLETYHVYNKIIYDRRNDENRS